MKTIPGCNLAEMKRWWRVLFAGFLAGCASTPDLVNGRLIPPPGQAYLIVATTYDVSKGAAINGESGVEIAGPDKPFSLVSTPGNRRIEAPDEESAKGALHLVAVPPGEYRIQRAFGSYQESSFDIGVGYAAGRYNAIGLGIGTSTGGGRHTFAVPLKHTFQLQAGEVAYIGDVHILLDRIPSASVRINVRRDFNHMQTIWKVQDFSNVQIRPVSGMQSLANCGSLVLLGLANFFFSRACSDGMLSRMMHAVVVQYESGAPLSIPRSNPKLLPYFVP